MGKRIAALACLALAATAGAAWAAYSGTTSNPTSTITAKRIYPAERSWSAFKVADASGGAAETDASAPLGYAGDGLIYTTGDWSSAFSSTRYVDFDYNAPLAAGLPVANAKLNVRVLGNANGDTVCYYVELRRKSTNAVVAAYGSSAAPVDCETGATYGTLSTALPALADTDLANDLRIRLYASESNNRPARFDLLTVTGTYYGTVFTLHRQTLTDASTGTPGTADTWSLAASDSNAYQSAGNWNNAFSTSRYLNLTFPTGYIPAGATVTGVTLDHAYRSATSGDNTCWYFETYSGTTLLGTHGSAASPVNCNSTASFVTDSVSLPEVDTGSKAQGLIVKIYVSNSGKRKTLHDLIRLRVSYSLGSTGCVDPGLHTYQASGDSWIQQDDATSNNGSSNQLQVKANLSKNRRALVTFDLPQLPTGCSLTQATLLLFLQRAQGPRTINAYQVSSAWTENAVTWNNQPSVTGSAATAATVANNTWMQWTVTSLVQAMMAGTNYGFMLEDSAEDTGNNTQTYQSREGTNVPELDLTFG